MNEIPTSNYIFKVKEYKLPNRYKKQVTFQRVIGIGVYDLITKVHYPSQLTSYIRDVYSEKSGSLSSQKNAANELVKFLNFVLQEIELENPIFIDLKKEGLKALSLVHGSEYITYLTNKYNNGLISYDYVYRIEDYLNKFYMWLITQKINLRVSKILT